MRRVVLKGMKGFIQKISTSMPSAATKQPQRAGLALGGRQTGGFVKPGCKNILLPGRLVFSQRILNSIPSHFIPIIDLQAKKNRAVVKYIELFASDPTSNEQVDNRLSLILIKISRRSWVTQIHIIINQLEKKKFIFLFNSHCGYSPHPHPFRSPSCLSILPFHE